MDIPHRSMNSKNLARINPCWIVVFFLTLGLTVIGSAYGARENVTLTVYPCNDVVNSFKKFTPLVSYLHSETGIEVRLVFFPDFQSYAKALKNHELDFVFMDPMVYLKYKDYYMENSLLISLTLDGKNHQSGVVIVRKDSGITSLDGLNGKRIIFGPYESTPRWAAARFLFRQRGIDLDTGLKEYTHGGCCEDIAFNVFMKAVDAGVVCDHFLGQHDAKQRDLGVDAEQLLSLAQTRPVPTRVFASTQNVDNELVDKMINAVLSLDRQKPDHAKILKKAELGGFVKTVHADVIRLKQELEALGDSFENKGDSPLS